MTASGNVMFYKMRVKVLQEMFPIWRKWRYAL